MKRIVATAILFSLLAISCGGSDDVGTSGDLAATSGLSAGSCLVGDPECADGADAGAAGELPEAIVLGDPNDPDAPQLISFGGFFYSDGTDSQLCSALAESSPPQCASLVIDIEAPDLDVILEHVAEAFGSPEDANVNIDQGIYWTDDWINLTGALQANRLVLE